MRLPAEANGISHCPSVSYRPYRALSSASRRCRFPDPILKAGIKPGQAEATKRRNDNAVSLSYEMRARNRTGIGVNFFL